MPRSGAQATYGGPKVLRLQPRSSSEPAGARAARATAWSDVPDTVPDRSMPDFPPERSVPDRMPERSMPDRVPERSVPDRMPERSVPDRLPERYVPERVSERFMPDRMVECSIPDRKDPWAEGQPGRSGLQDFGLADVMDDFEEMKDSWDEPPTSQVVKSYFGSAASSPSLNGRPRRQQHGDPHCLHGPLDIPEEASIPSRSSAEAEVNARAQVLEQQIRKYKRENEALEKLKAQAEQAQRDFLREREKLWHEVEVEKSALHAEFEAERVALRREKRRLAQGLERQRQQLTEERSLQEENRRLREKDERLEEEMKEKERRWQLTTNRLTRQVGDLARRNQELESDLRCAGQQVQQAEQAKSVQERRSSSLGGRRGASSSKTRSTVPSTGGGDEGFHRPDRLQSKDAEDRDPELREERVTDGRVERLYIDGRREVEFPNGLRKVMWPDGRTSVMFQNGDHKEIHPDGVVEYSYKATGAVQTTLPDGTERYRFADGQSERHMPDGAKEIHFPNGTSKQIFADGSEEVVFADGTVRFIGAGGAGKRPAA